MEWLEDEERRGREIRRR